MYANTSPPTPNSLACLSVITPLDVDIIGVDYDITPEEDEN